MTTIKIMSLRHSAFYSPLLMTMAGPYLRDEGLDYEYAVATPQRTIVQALNDGSCHIAQSAVAVGFADLERGISGNIAHFAQINSRDGFFIAGRKPEPDFSFTRLRGKRVLVDHLFQPLAMLRFALHLNGIGMNELTVIDAGDVASMDRAFRQGEGDYVHQQGPAPQQLECDGLGYVVASVGQAIGPVAFSSLCAVREFLTTDLARAFTRAYRRARGDTLTTPAKDLAATMRQANFFPGIDPEVLERTIAAYQQLGCWSGDIEIEPDAYERLLDVFEFNGMITQRHAYRSLIADPPR